MENIIKKISVGLVFLLIVICHNKPLFGGTKLRTTQVSDVHIAKVSINCRDFYADKYDFFLKRLPRFFHYAIDSGFYAMLFEGKINPNNVKFTTLRYKNKVLYPHLRNMDAIVEFYDKIESEGDIFLRKFLNSESDIDFIIFWDPAVVVMSKDTNKPFRVLAVIQAYDRNNNLMQYHQLKITNDILIDVNKLKPFIAKHVKEFAGRLWNIYKRGDRGR
jgi:hypothetical protein